MATLDTPECFMYRFGENLTIRNADKVEKGVEKAISSLNETIIVLDLEVVRECDSYGLRVFLILYRKAKEANKGLVLYRPSPTMVELLKTTRLDVAFTIVNSLEDIPVDL